MSVLPRRQPPDLPTPPVPIPPAVPERVPVLVGLNTWAAVVVITTMVLAVVLFLTGHPAGVVLGLLGGAAYLGIEIVSRLTGGSGPGDGAGHGR